MGRKSGGRICIGAPARSRQDAPRLMVPEAMGGKAEWRVGLGGEIYSPLLLLGDYLRGEAIERGTHPRASGSMEARSGR